MSEPFQPTIADIILVKKIFCKVFLPVELIDQILDEASYWPCSSVTIERSCTVPCRVEYNVDTSFTVEDKMYMRTLPLAVNGAEGDVILTEEDFSQVGLDHDGSESFHLGTDDEEEVDRKRWCPPRGEHPCRKIVFQLWTKDQGWSDDRGNHGTYQGSYTWYDASVETLTSDMLNRGLTWPAHLFVCDSNAALLTDSPFNFIQQDPDHPFLPPPTHLQRNIHAKGEIHHHTITWHYLDSIDENSQPAIEADLNGRGWKSLDGNFVRSLKVGDCVTLWMRARFGGWKSCLEKAKIEVYWAV